MRRTSSLPADPDVPRTRRGDWATIRTLLPYLWEYKGRVIAALACLVLAKVANVGVPLLLKQIVDSLDRETALLAVPLALLVAYGLLRLSTTLFTELREFLFAKVTQRAVRKIALQVFRHLHALSLRFHLHAADRRPHARRRARPARHLDADPVRAVLDPAHAGRDHAGVGDPDRALRLDVHGDHRRRARRLHRVHRARHRVAHALPAHDERARLARPTRARSTACSTTRPSSTSATRTGRRAATTRACSAGSRRR